MKTQSRMVRTNLRLARDRWGELGKPQLKQLKDLTEKHHLSVLSGDLLFLDHGWYVTHTGLVHLAQRRRCAGIRVQQVNKFCDVSANRWVFKATVYKSAGSKGFVGYGDADPSNVSLLVSGAEMRVAETRAVNRALRKAYGIGLCSVEELGTLRRSSPDLVPSAIARPQPVAGTGNGSHNGQTRLRDRLCLLVRQHRLDPTLVKRYAAEYCGTATLRDSSREQVEAFVNHLAEWASQDREGLVCKLNSLAPVEEVTP
jgi:hypothetical protein